jgi:hypothetical protein
VINTAYLCLGSENKESMMGWACYLDEGGKKCIQNFGGETF